MLVLSRKLQEQIRIGDDVTITILRIKGNTVRIGIEAPRTKRVIRAELPVLEALGGEGAVDAEAEASEGLATSLDGLSASSDEGADEPFSTRDVLTLRDRLRRHWPAPATR
jgi:carbon storage regulator